MSARKVEQDIAAPSSARNHRLFGHRDAEMALLDAYRSGRIPHAWLIGGAQGIGKATLAYRMARFVLAHPQSAGAGGATRRDACTSIPPIRSRAMSPPAPMAAC